MRRNAPSRDPLAGSPGKPVAPGPLFNSPNQPSEKRYHHRIRCRLSVAALIVLENDAIRRGIPAEILDLSSVGAALVVDRPLDVGTRFLLTLESHLHRLRVEVRAVVRRAEPVPGGRQPPGPSIARDQHAGAARLTATEAAGRWRLGCSLQTPLTPLEVMSLRRPTEFGAAGPEPRWF